MESGLESDIEQAAASSTFRGCGNVDRPASVNPFLDIVESASSAEPNELVCGFDARCFVHVYLKRGRAVSNHDLRLACQSSTAV
jgi:hypothetical protein